MRLLSILTAGVACLPGLAIANAAQYSRDKIFLYPNILTTGPVDAQFAVRDAYQPLDAPHVSPRPNTTSFNYWYFDAVNPANLNETVIVVFWLATNASFPFRPTSDNSVSADVIFTLADGTNFPVMIDAKPANFTPRGEAEINITHTDEGVSFVSGDWKTTGLSFEQTEEGFEIKIDAYWMGLTGTVKFLSIVPPRIPCAEDLPLVGASFEAIPHTGWTDAAPDADAEVDISLNSRGENKKLSFKGGYGYHDSRWGDRPLQTSVKDWYWGHARVNDTSIIWHQATSHDGQNYTNVYMNNHKESGGARIGCERNCGDLLAIHNNGNITCLEVTMLDKIYKFAVEKTNVLTAHSPLSRWSGRINAADEKEDGSNLMGTALFEEYHFA